MLASCYNTAMQLAEENRLKSIAFSCISTGIYGYPKREAARIAIDTIIRHLNDGYDGEVIICCFSAGDKSIYDEKIKDMRCL